MDENELFQKWHNAKMAYTCSRRWLKVTFCMYVLSLFVGFWTGVFRFFRKALVYYVESDVSLSVANQEVMSVCAILITAIIAFALAQAIYLLHIRTKKLQVLYERLDKASEVYDFSAYR